MKTFVRFVNELKNKKKQTSTGVCVKKKIEQTGRTKYGAHEKKWSEILGNFSLFINYNNN